MNLSLNERLEFLKHKQPPSAGTDDIYRTVSFTGYRPGKLPFGDDYECEMARKLKSALMSVFEQFFLKNYNCFLTGGAMGSDLLAADAISEMLKSYGKKASRSISFICLPCHNHIKNWSQKEKDYLERLLNNGNFAFYVSDRPYYKGCMQVRNEYMVDNSSAVVAVYDGKSGGTKNTLDYAEKMKKKIVTIDPSTALKTEFFVTNRDTSYHFNFLHDNKAEYKTAGCTN